MLHPLFHLLFRAKSIWFYWSKFKIDNSSANSALHFSFIRRLLLWCLPYQNLQAHHHHLIALQPFQQVCFDCFELSCLTSIPLDPKSIKTRSGFGSKSQTQPASFPAPLPIIIIQLIAGDAIQPSAEIWYRSSDNTSSQLITVGKYIWVYKRLAVVMIKQSLCKLATLALV